VEFHVCCYQKEQPGPWAVVSSSKATVFSSELETPRHKAVAFGRVKLHFLAVNVKLHGARPWHLLPVRFIFTRSTPHLPCVLKQFSGKSGVLICSDGGAKLTLNVVKKSTVRVDDTKL